jgi:hypothetical protein
MLFQLICQRLLPGAVSSLVPAVPLNCPIVYIELANTVVANELLSRIPICQYFERTSVVWDPRVNALVVPQDVTSDFQVVCNYLQLLDSENVDQVMLTFDGYPTIEFGAQDGGGQVKGASRISSDRCAALLDAYFFTPTNKEGQAATYSLLNTFIAVAAEQLRLFTVSPSFRTDSLHHAGHGTTSNVRKHIVTGLLTAARSFAMRSVPSAAPGHIGKSKGLGEAVAMAQRMEQIVSFENAEYLLLLIQPEGGFTPLYRDEGVFLNKASGTPCVVSTGF